MAKTKPAGREAAETTLLMNTGRGVKSILEANEKRIKPPQKALTFSLFNFSVIDAPSRSLEATKTPRDAKSTLFSILTKLLSNTKTGSLTSTKDKTKPTMFKPLQTNNVVAELNP
jgi:hypothetical protein